MEKIKNYNDYISTLRVELLPALGCTEPIALAYAAATAREVLGKDPDKVIIKVSGSMIKNVKSVIVPNTGNMKGLDAAAAAGIVAGKAQLKLEVLSQITEKQINQIKEFIKKTTFEIVHIEEGHVFDIVVILSSGTDCSEVRISDYHTNIVYIEKNGKRIFDGQEQSNEERKSNYSFLTVKGIWNFAKTCELNDVRDLIISQIDCNKKISEEGLAKEYGANVGKNILNNNPKSVRFRAIAKAAAASDARMNGCEMPVIINSGSGNQGLTCSLPVIEYADEYSKDEESLIRALVFSNLISIHIKSGIGTLSAYCGAVSAATAAVSGIMFLMGEEYELIAHMITNSLVTTSGIVCDGAKASCASKIATSLFMALLAYDMVRNNDYFENGDGLVGKDIEKTIENIGRLGNIGMSQTNTEILDIMIE